MTPEREKEIRERLAAFKHWKLKSECPSSYEESHGPDMEELLAEIDSLRDELGVMQFNLEQKSKEIGRSEHRGNTVDYIYDKCELYGKQLIQIAAERDQLRARVKRLRATLLFYAERDEREISPAKEALAQDDEMEGK